MNYIDSCTDSIIKLILQGLSIIDFEEDEEGEDWGHAISAGCCLQKLALLIGNNVMQPVFTYVSENIVQTNWKQKYAALIALGSITEGPEKQQFVDVIMPTLTNLLLMFKDPNSNVRQAISWVFSRICEHHADVIMTQEVSNLVIPVLQEALKDKLRISNQCCAAFEKLAQACAP